ncbi:MAG: sigma-54-dependent transcriptional regulator [Candidatus Sumerlaeaceae bacterium]
MSAPTLQPHEESGVDALSLSHVQQPALPLRVLLVGRDMGTLSMLAQILTRQGRQAMAARDPGEAAGLLSGQMPDIAIVDVATQDADELTYLAELRRRYNDLGIIVTAGDDSVALAEKAVVAGADHILAKPIQPWALQLAVDKLAELREQRQRVLSLQRELTFSVRDAAFPDIVTNSDCMKAVLRLVEKVSSRDLSVLICGESGTGKELVARAIHQASSRARGNFIELNCAALPPNLVESELFGHEKGAFTGAVTARAGKIEQASGGTLFLDEIGELPLEMQPKLLRALQERRITRIGGRGLIESDFRLVCATNRDLVEEVKTGRFREDLFYRIAVFPIQLPPLRERIVELELLLSHFLRQEGASRPIIASSALDMLAKYRWPGNVRELKNFAQAVMLLSDGGHIDEAAVHAYFGSRLNLNACPDKPKGPRPVRRIDEVEREEIMNAMQFFNGNVPEAARALGIGRATLYKYLNRSITQTDF